MFIRYYVSLVCVMYRDRGSKFSQQHCSKDRRPGPLLLYVQPCQPNILHEKTGRFCPQEDWPASLPEILQALLACWAHKLELAVLGNVASNYWGIDMGPSDCEYAADIGSAGPSAEEAGHTHPLKPYSWLPLGGRHKKCWAHFARHSHHIARARLTQAIK